MEKKVVNILKRYQTRYWYGYPMYATDDIAMPAIAPTAVRESTAGFGLSKATSLASDGGAASTASVPYSQTNTQVFWVDEADSVKTDGKYFYAFSEESHEIRILRVADLSLRHTIRLPENFSGINMYLASGRLVVVGQKYVTSGNSWTARWYAPETKTILAVYNVADTTNPILERYAQIDGDYRDSRVIGDTLYLVSASSLRMPPIYITPYIKDTKTGFSSAMTAVEKWFSLKTFAPEVRESYRNTKGKYLQSIRSSVANCKDVTFVLPDEKTLATTDFTPALVTLSSVNITDPTARLKSELLFGDVSQIHMSKSALYITSVISQEKTSSLSSSKCAPGTRCVDMVYRPSVSSTLVHKYALTAGWLSYKYSTTIPGNPMSQYSMDEDASGNFRIVTQKYDWSTLGNANTTGLYVLSPLGRVIGKLEGLAPGENFQSSRFIGARLYLVTFEQIDPLFVIDISKPTDPYVLGELKIPGYSTYLHPYDDDRLIGIGYDTKTNQWGWVQNAGLKIDLYNVRDVKNPRQEATLTLGGAGSSAEALSNPRAFVYYKEKNLLLMPATIMKSANDPNDSYRSIGAFQWVVGVSLSPSSIIEKFRVSHITLSKALEDEWKKDCARYTAKTNKCYTLLDGSQYCDGGGSYVPPYCYAGSTVETYLASNLWNYQRDFVTRTLYVGEQFYSFSEGSIRSWNFSNTTSPTAATTFAPSPIKNPIYPVPMMVK
jgi:inhibitor of cysteine peptidase